MLTIDDIPEEYPAREWCFRRHVDQFWSKKPSQVTLNNKEIFHQIAKIDSTFGLLRSSKSFKRLLDGIRVYYPYEAKHLDWYIIPSKETQDQLHYMTSSNKLISNWGAKHYKKAPLHPILSPKERDIYVTTKNDGKIELKIFHLPGGNKKHLWLYNILINFYLNTKSFFNFSIIGVKKLILAMLQKITDNLTKPK